MGFVNHSTSRQRLQQTSFPKTRGNGQEPAGNEQLTVIQHDTENSDNQKRKAVEMP